LNPKKSTPVLSYFKADSTIFPTACQQIIGKLAKNPASVYNKAIIREHGRKNYESYNRY
jgi:hypothetical protein